MAGFFGLFDYTKPGKGVDPDAPEKKPFFRFWELYWRKFTKLILINIIYFIIISPILLYLFGVFYNLLSAILKVDIGQIQMYLFPIMVSIASSVPNGINQALLVISIILFGPATAGMTFMMRNFTREEHAWMTDFFERAKANFMQGLFFGVLDVLIFLLMSVNFSYISNAEVMSKLAPVAQSLIKLSGYFSAFVLVIYIFMRNYFYMLLITFDLRIVQILKNSFIFAILGLWRNLLSLVLTIIVGIAVLLIHPLAELVLMPLFALSFWGFMTVFICYPLVKKMMIDPILKKEQEENNPEQGEISEGNE